MPTWNSDQYLKFANERTQPAVDLAARVDVAAPQRAIDLGCGPGNSTAVLANRWPAAKLAGLDNSAAMLVSARKNLPAAQWIEGDITTWTAGAAAASFDVVFANASLHWVPAHTIILPQLLAAVAPGGALAFQVPANFDAPPHRLMRELGSSEAWRPHFAPPPREWHAHTPEFYYDTLAPLAARVELWSTDYIHVLTGVDGIVEWYRGTGLRPWLDALPDEPTRNRFLADYRALLAPHFPSRSDGRILFPFRRLFVITYR
jgi:trans-aconitate 2-methyltransferase